MINIVNIANFSNVEIDGDNVGDCFSAVANYPEHAGAILAALSAYEQDLIAAAAPAEVPSIDPGQITQLQQQIATLKLELTPAISEITPALMGAGLNAWGARATKSPQLMAMLMELFAIALETRSAGQCQRISTLFVDICQLSQEIPTPAEAQAMQAILDVGPRSTGPISAKYLSFAPWM
jgi:hypothetical protein